MTTKDIYGNQREQEAEQLRELNERSQRLERELARTRQLMGLPATFAEQVRQTQQKMIEQGRWNGTLLSAGEPPLVSDYNRAPDRHVDEADVRADESDEEEASPLGGTDQATGYNLERSTHNRWAGVHAHGQFAQHVHMNDADHSRAPLKAGPYLGKNY